MRAALLCRSVHRCAIAIVRRAAFARGRTNVWTWRACVRAVAAQWTPYGFARCCGVRNRPAMQPIRHLQAPRPAFKFGLGTYVAGPLAPRCQRITLPKPVSAWRGCGPRRWMRGDRRTVGRVEDDIIICMAFPYHGAWLAVVAVPVSLRKDIQFYYW